LSSTAYAPFGRDCFSQWRNNVLFLYPPGLVGGGEWNATFMNGARAEQYKNLRNRSRMSTVKEIRRFTQNWGKWKRVTNIETTTELRPHSNLTALIWYAETSRTLRCNLSQFVQIKTQGQILKTCKQLFPFLVTYFHWWCNVIFIFVNNSKKYHP